MGKAWREYKKKQKGRAEPPTEREQYIMGMNKAINKNGFVTLDQSILLVMITCKPEIAFP